MAPWTAVSRGKPRAVFTYGYGPGYGLRWSHGVSSDFELCAITPMRPLRNPENLADLRLARRCTAR